MAGTTTKSRQTGYVGSDVRDLVINHNKVIDDLATVRAGASVVVQYEHEQLAADADIAARPIFVAPAALTVTSVLYIPRGNSAGIDGSNTLVVTLRNITAGEDVATVTRTTDLTGGTALTVTITAANADVASGAVLGLTITQGTSADVDIGILQFTYQLQSADAAADLTAAKVGDASGTAITV